MKSTSTISELVCMGNLIWHLEMAVFPLKLTRGNRRPLGSRVSNLAPCIGWDT